MIGKEQTYHILDRDFPVESVRVLGEHRLAAVVTYESGQLHMVPDCSVECYAGQEFVELPAGLLVFNPAGVVAEPEPNKFYLSIENQEGLHYLLCCDEFPDQGESFTDF